MNYSQEKIRFNTEIIKVLVISILAIGGSVIGVILGGIFNNKSARVYLITYGGLVVTFILIGALIYLYRDTLSLINQARNNGT